MLGAGQVNKVFFLGFFFKKVKKKKKKKKKKKMVTNMKLAFSDVPFRDNSACVKI